MKTYKHNPENIMKRLAYTISILFLTCGAFAQDMTDALKYSDHRISGTARSEAMGNAFGALGGDFSALSINPAGVGVYRSGEFTFSTALGKINIDGSYLGNTVNDSKYNVGISNLGYVATIPTGQNSESGLVSVNIGVGFNRLGSFSMNRTAETPSSNYSILGYFTENMNANHDYYHGNEGQLDPYYERLAWDTYLINHDDAANEYFNDVTDAGYKQLQRNTTARRGYINEYLVSLGANFNHKFYVGATVGIHDIYFKENSTLYEYDNKNVIPYFTDLYFNSSLKQLGTGFNVKLGAIYKPIDALRLGIAVHTPTFYKFTETYDNSMSTSTFDNGQPVYPDKPGTYDFELETPMKAVFSGAYVIGKVGLISVDYEWIDYSTAKLKNGSDGYNYYDEDKVISNTYRSVGNLHVGGEYRVNSMFSLRAGYENYPSAFKSGYMNGNIKSSTVSGGFGFKQGNFFLDATLKHYTNEEYSKLYPGDINMAKYSMQTNNVIFTFGYKF